MVTEPPVGYLKGEMEHYDRRGLGYHIAKHNTCSTLETARILQPADRSHLRCRGKFLGRSDGLPALAEDARLAPARPAAGS